MKNLLTLLLTFFIVTSCSEPMQETPDMVPTSDTTVLMRKKTVTPPPPTVVYMDSTDWNITWDTSYCGSIYIRWTAQNRPAGSTNYYFFVSPMASTCSGGLNTTSNVLFYTYGYGCSFWPSSTYTVYIRYNWTDVANNKLYVYTSKSVTVKTGRGAWYCN